MPGRGEAYLNALKVCGLPPVEFRDTTGIYAPADEVSFHAQGHEIVFHLGFQALNADIVQVIVMIVGHQEQINIWQLIGDIQAVFRKTFGGGRRNGRGIRPEHGVDEDGLILQAHEYHRVSVPYKPGLRGILEEGLAVERRHRQRFGWSAFLVSFDLFAQYTGQLSPVYG